jgi:hypothetical protein
MFHDTIEPDAGMTSPSGNWNMYWNPTTFWLLYLLMYTSGTVGAVVVHASAVVDFPVGSDGFSAKTVTGDVGLTPTACGLPMPIVKAVDAVLQK